MNNTSTAFSCHVIIVENLEAVFCFELCKIGEEWFVLTALEISAFNVVENFESIFLTVVFKAGFSHVENFVMFFVTNFYIVDVSVSTKTEIGR